MQLGLSLLVLQKPLPSISKALFSLRSLTFVAKYLQLSREDAAKADNEALEVIKTINEERNNAVTLMDMLNKAQESYNHDSGHTIEMERAYQNDQIAYLIERMGFEEGIIEARERAKEIVEKTFKIEEKIATEERNRLYMANDFSKVRGMDINKVATAIKHQEKLGQLEERRLQVMQSYTENPGEVNAAVKKLDKQIEAQKLVAKQAKEQSGYDIIQNSDGTFTTGEAPNRGDPLMEGLKKFKKVLLKNLMV